MIELNKIYNEECLEGMKKIPDNSIDMILCDLPYGTTYNKWDIIISFEQLWGQYNRIIKKGGAIVLTGSQPFTSKLVMSNIDNFKYEYIWEKQRASNFIQAKKQPLKYHENILVFGKGSIETYSPQKYKAIEIDEIMKFNKKQMIDFLKSKEYDKFSKVDKRKNVINQSSNKNYLGTEGLKRTRNIDEGTRYPKSVIKINNKLQKNIHPTQKPVELFEYLIKTYTKENEVVLDNCMGSGTTAIACLNIKRNFIGFELDKGYYEIAQNRIEEKIKSNYFV